MTAYHESHYDQILEPLLARDTLNYDIEQPPFVAFSERPGWKAATRLTGQSAEIFCVASISISNDFIDPLSFMFLCCGQNH